ncbi:MAG TPA: hypothetical protein VI912_01855 [Candidatus Bilamarchaeaceae archaeon]|nr:hypothetical protein [Candidatus Bilamarchaeaceae archaeon]
MAKKFRERIPSEPVELLFYELVTKKDAKTLKPLKDLNTKAPMSIVKAVLDNVISESFYTTLNKDLKSRGVKEGTVVQVRAKFNESHQEISPQFKGTLVLCEVTIK